MERAKELWERINSELSKVIIGKEDIKRLLMVALLSEGHVLIEGLPGTGKTKLAMSFARIIGGDFKLNCLRTLQPFCCFFINCYYWKLKFFG